MSLISCTLPVGGVAFAFEQSNAAGKVIVAVLFAGSILAWSLMLTKYYELKQARRVSQRFLTAYRREAHPAALFLKHHAFDASPLYAIYLNTCRALGAALQTAGGDDEDLFAGAVGVPDRRLGQTHVGSVRSVAERAMADQALLAENSMGLLATATTTAPFLGLLGTVWGVMDAFGGMAVTGTPMLGDVAPGISGALLTTVVGLLVALPSAIGYNLLTDRIRRLAVEMDNFVQELMAAVEQHYLKN